MGVHIRGLHYPHTFSPAAIDGFDYADNGLMFEDGAEPPYVEPPTPAPVKWLQHLEMPEGSAGDWWVYNMSSYANRLVLHA